MVLNVKNALMNRGISSSRCCRRKKGKKLVHHLKCESAQCTNGPSKVMIVSALGDNRHTRLKLVAEKSVSNNNVHETAGWLIG